MFSIKIYFQSTTATWKIVMNTDTFNKKTHNLIFLQHLIKISQIWYKTCHLVKKPISDKRFIGNFNSPLY